MSRGIVRPPTRKERLAWLEFGALNVLTPEFIRRRRGKVAMADQPARSRPPHFFFCEPRRRRYAYGHQPASCFHAASIIESALSAGLYAGSIRYWQWDRNGKATSWTASVQSVSRCCDCGVWAPVKSLTRAIRPPHLSALGPAWQVARERFSRNLSGAACRDCRAWLWRMARFAKAIKEADAQRLANRRILIEQRKRPRNDEASRVAQESQHDHHH